MKHPSLRVTAACLSITALLLATGAKLHAQTSNNPLITLQENGLGTIQFLGRPAAPLPGLLIPDPGPGGLASALTFNLLGPPSLVAGDLFVFELAMPGILSDVVRFNPAGTGGNAAYPASVVFYSIPGEGQLADTGFPSSFYPNTFSLVENALGEVLYTPTVGQPGFVAGFGVTYNIISTPAAGVPDTGTSALLFGISIAALFVLQRALTAHHTKAVALA